MRERMDVLKGERLFKYLDDQEIIGIIDRLREGLKYSAFNAIMRKSNFTFYEWSIFLNISERTLQRYKRDNKSFDLTQSERIIQIEMIRQLGNEVFGSNQKFSRWLELENIALMNRSPKEFLDNSFGIALVRDELIRIEHGVFS